MSDGIFAAFLEGEPVSEETKKRRRVSRVWFGASERRDTKLIKPLCCGDDPDKKMTAFCPLREMMGTHALAQVPKLLATGLWTPVGFTDAMVRKAILTIQDKLDGDARRAADVAAKAADEEAQRAQRAADDAARKDAAIRARQLGGGSFSDAEVAEAAALGIPHEVLMATPRMDILGPSNTQPILRVRIHFRFREAERARREILEAHTVLMDRDAGGVGGASSSGLRAAKRPYPRRAASTNAGDVIARLQREEVARVAAEKRRAEDDKNDTNRLALEHILKKAAAVGRVRLTKPSRCSVCQEHVDDQFLECSCCDATAGGWETCDVCALVCHTSKAPCNCMRGR
jgi:hypothetical protein